MTGTDRVLRCLTIAAVVALGAYAIIDHRLLTGGLAWLAVLFFVFSGWGYLVVRVARTADVDFGLRALWGVAAFLAVAGIPVAIGTCSRPVLLGLAAVGLLAFGWRELVVATPIWQSIRSAGTWLRANPALAVLAILLGAFALLQLIGAVAKLDRNAWDDDLAYTPLVRRLLDAGNLVEPFSFRRLAAYGGQTVLQGLGAAHGVLSNTQLVDRGLGLGLTLLLVIGHARRLGRVPTLWLATLVLLLLVVPDMPVNTASYWTGAAMFIGLYRTVALAEDAPRTMFVLAGVIGAATATLRQNYLPVVGLFLAFALLFRLRRAAWRDERRTWIMTVAAAIAVLLPWCVAAYVSSHTFLFPVIDGTWNHALSLQPRGETLVDQLSFVVTACVDSQPVVIVPILFLVAAATTDRRVARPLTAMFLATTLGFLLLARSFGGADVYSLWRYAFGFVIALTCVLSLEAGIDEDGPARIVPIGRWVLLAALVLQIGFVRTDVIKRMGMMLRDIRESAAADRRGDPSARVEARRYAAMQAHVPAGAQLAVMLDDPEYLDFARNDIANLDVPGYASPEPQMPMFCGTAALRRYFLDQGLRYLAFVRPDASRYFFRRDYWVHRIFADKELFQVMSAYAIDAIDSFTALATEATVLYDHDGLVVLDLVGAPPTVAACDPLEGRRRDAFVRALAAKEGIPAAWSLSPHSDLVFSDGVSNITFVDDTDPSWMPIDPTDPWPGRGHPVRWMDRRVHLRVRAERDMHLRITGQVRVQGLYTRPRLDLAVGGEPLASVVADDHGLFTLDVQVPHALLDGWTDVYVLFNTVGTPGKGHRGPAHRRAARGDMGTARAVIARTVVALAIAVPWLAFLHPRHQLGGALLAVLALAASFHGWGAGLAALVRRRVEPALAVAWGISVATASVGAAMSASLCAQLPLLLVGLVLHGLVLGIRFEATATALESSLRGEALRWWIVPTLLIVAIGTLHALGAVGGATLRPFDDDGHVLAQVRRLLDTGTLADPVGYARGVQLGGGVALGALGSVFGDLAFVHLADALGFVLVLVLVCRAIGPRDAATSIWAGLVVVTLGFVAVLWPDPSPLWLPIALALALARTAAEPAPVPAMLIPVGMLAGALIALRLEWLPFAAVLAAAAWLPREHARQRAIRACTLVAATLFVVLPYVLVRSTALSGVNHAVAALVTPHRSVAASALIALAIVVVALPVTALVFARMPGGIVRWTALATVASIAAMAGRLTAAAPYYGRYTWPIAAAAALIIVVDVARDAFARLSALAMVLAAVFVLLGYEARVAHGHRRLTVHYADLLGNIEYARSATSRVVDDPDYAKLLALVPGKRVGVWVVRPERIDYSRHAIVDVRVPRVSVRRARPWQTAETDSVIRVLRAAKLRYVLFEDDGAAQRYAEENPIACWLRSGPCVDPLERMLATQHLLGASGATRLYELR